MQTQGFHPKRILVPTDFSASAQVAVATAAELAKQFQSEVYLLNVIPMLPIVGVPGYSTAMWPEEEYLANARSYAGDKLTELERRLKSEGIFVQSSVVVGNDVVGNIMMIVERQRADLILLSTHGVSGWRPMIFGSIAEKVIKLVECPLLLLRTPKNNHVEQPTG